MRISLNSEEKALMKQYGRLSLKFFCLPEDYYGHYWIDTTDRGTYVRPKKRGLKATKEKVE